MVKKLTLRPGNMQEELAEVAVARGSAHGQTFPTHLHHFEVSILAWHMRHRSET
jgi:hypothetical protein